MEIDGNTLFFVIILLFILFSGPGGDGVSSQYEFNQLSQFRKTYVSEHERFQNSTVSTNFKDITGFKLSYEDALNGLNPSYPLPGKQYDTFEYNQQFLILPNEIIEKVNNNIWNKSKADTKDLYPSNITSTVSGKLYNIKKDEFTRIKMPIPKFYEPPQDFSELNPPEGEFEISDDEKFDDYNKFKNLTFEEGNISMEFWPFDEVYLDINESKKSQFNTQSDKWKLLKTKLTINDDSEKEKHVIYAKAIYDLRKGRILFMTQSAKFHSQFAFPHYMAINDDDDDKTFEEVKQLIEEYWTTQDYTKTLIMTDLQRAFEDSVSSCEFVGFFQLNPWSQYTKDQLDLIEKELKWPLGRPANLSSLPPIKLDSGLLYSPDCGLRLDLNNVEGVRYELKIRTIRNHLIVGLILLFVQIYLLLLQMNYTNTPSSINKISVITLSMIHLVDAAITSFYFIASKEIPELYLPLLISTFACILLASIFEARYMMTVYLSQINEQNVGIMTLLRGSLREDEPRTTVIPDEAAISSSFHVRLIFTLICFIFIMVSSVSWPKDVRKVFEYIVTFTLNSYWIPQIFRNVIKGSPPRRSRMHQSPIMQRQNRIPLLWKFIIGTSIIRLLPILYLFIYPSNAFKHHTDKKFAYILIVWMTFQIMVLYSQDILGSRWFLPKHVIPEGYCYHRSLSAQDLLEHAANENFVVDCAVCMSELPLYVEDVPETHKVDQNSYMITPCNHIFHTACLENWMSYKLQCPVCRAPLPPL